MGLLEWPFGETKKMGIYAIVNRVDGKQYVGSSTNIKKRWGDHRYLLRYNKHPNVYLQYAFNKHSEAAFELRVLQEVTDEDTLLAVEQYWLDYTRCYDHEYGYNIDPSAERYFVSDETRAKIGAGNSGKKRSPEVRAKISATLKGRPLSEETRKKMIGRTHTEETRAKISAAGRGRVVSEETRAKISVAQKGRTPSDEARAKMKGRGPSAEARARMSAANKGRIPSDKARARMSEAHKGRTLSEQARAKLSAANRGKTIPKDVRAKISAARRANPLSNESRGRIVEARRVLTPEQVQEIRKRLADGEAIRSIAEAYRVNYYTIWNILKGKTWVHLPPAHEE